MSNLNNSILINPSDECIKALLSKLVYENLSNEDSSDDFIYSVIVVCYYFFKK